MLWKEITVTVPVQFIEQAGNIAMMTVPYGISIEDYRDLEEAVLEIAHIDLIDEDLLKKDRTKGSVHLYIQPEDNPAEAAAFLRQRLEAEGITCEIAMSDSEDEDWLNNWKKYFKPLTVGKKLLIRPVWEDAVPDYGRLVLNLEPGLAFGTGTHETTRLCLELLEEYLKPGDEILDIGCGSGILSVAGLLLGGSSAVGVDIDAAAVKTAAENLRINGFAGQFTPICGNLTEHVTGTYDVILSNVVADVLIILKRDVKKYMKPGAVWIISGIIDARLGDVKAALGDDFTILSEIEEKGWYALALS